MATPDSIIACRTPIIHAFTTSDLAPILARSGLGPSITTLLEPFESSVERVNVRSSNYEPRLLPRFAVKFVERPLPAGFGEAVEEGVVMQHHRTRSGTVGTAGEPFAMAPAPPAVTTPTLQYHPLQAERDELFLDSLSSLISQKVDGWIGQEGRAELVVRGSKARRRGEDVDTREEGDSDEGWQGRRVEALTPWYAAMRDEVLKRREMVEWDTFAWPVGCLLALSSSHPDPLNALSALWDLTSKEKLFSPASYPDRSGVEAEGRYEWANPDILRHIVLVHDVGAGGGRDGWEDAQKLHETIRKTYGLHTALLPLFSAAATAATPHPAAPGIDTLWKDSILDSTVKSVDPNVRRSSAVDVGGDGSSTAVVESPTAVRIEKGRELSEEDLKSLRIFMREMVVQSILPWIERSVVVGNEQFIASKRSIGGRLFSAGRKYFGGSNTSSRAGSPTSASGAPLGFNTAKGFYPYVAQESQTRRLADLAFMIGDYKLAASIYESASKDYKTDRAWRYFSSACRMTGLSQLLMHPPSTPLNFNPDTWLEQALQTPSLGAVDLDGLQAMMLYYEAYRFIGDWRPAPEGLVRTAGESDEGYSALLLEQAALADLQLPFPSKRKYAFHMAMAAARYEKTGLKSLSRRCLSQAASVFSIERAPDGDSPRTHLAGWSAVRSHLHHGLGRQAYNIGRADDAVEHFLELLMGSDDQGDHAVEQSWLDDFGLAWEHLGTDADRVVDERNLKLHATIFNPRDAHVRLVQSDGVSAVEARTEEWKALQDDFAGTTARERQNSGKAIKAHEAIVGETFYLELSARNPLDAPLAIGGLHVYTDAAEGNVEIDAPQEIELAPREALKIFIPVKATSLADFSFTSVSFRFNDLLPCAETLVGRPKRLNNTREQLTTATYAPDTTLLVTVRSAIPLLSIDVNDLPATLHAGETLSSSITVTNNGQVPLRDLRSLCSHPSYAMFHNNPSASIYTPSEPSSAGSITTPNRVAPNAPQPISLSTDGQDRTLQPGASLKIPILIRGDAFGLQTLRWIFSFHGPDSDEQLFSRVEHTLDVRSSLALRPFVRPSNSLANPYLLGLEVQNLSIPSDVVVTQVSSLSPRWRCVLLGDSTLKDDLGPLGWQQTGSIFLGVEAVPGVVASEAGTEFAVHKLNALLQGKDVKSGALGDVKLQQASMSIDSTVIDISTSPLLDAILQTHTTLRHVSLTAQLPTIPRSLHQHLFPLFNDRCLDLLVFWTSSSLGVQGHHHLTGIPIGAGSNALKEVLETAEQKAGGLYAESQRERSALLAGLRRSEFGVDQSPVAVLLEVSEFGEHDFENDGPCSIPVSFLIRNLSSTFGFDYTLNLSVTDSSSSSSQAAFVGAMSSVGRIEADARAEFQTTLWIPRNGTYDVGDWRIDIIGPGGKSWVEYGRRREVLVRDVVRDAATTS